MTKVPLFKPPLITSFKGPNNSYIASKLGSGRVEHFLQPVQHIHQDHTDYVEESEQDDIQLCEFSS